MVKYNIGCGKKILEDYVNFDIVPYNDKVLKLDFEHDSLPDIPVEEILMEHFFEHINNQERAIRECSRVLKHNGILKVILPTFSPQFVHKSTYHPPFYFVNLGKNKDVYYDMNIDLNLKKAQFKGFSLKIFFERIFGILWALMHKEIIFIFKKEAKH